MSYYLNRDINDMEDAIEGLRDVIGDVGNIVDKTITAKMEAVVEEWEGCCKPHLQNSLKGDK